MFLGPEGVGPWPVEVGCSILGFSGLSLGPNNLYESKNLSKLRHAYLWSSVTGIASFIIGGSITTALGAMPLGILMLSSNLVLNLYTTLFITTRLLLHRRMIMKWTRDKGLVTQHIYIVGILLESAAFNLPITVVTIAWFKSLQVEAVMIPTTAASQVNYVLFKPWPNLLNDSSIRCLQQFLSFIRQPSAECLVGRKKLKSAT